MKIAFLVKCPHCNKSTWVIMEDNPCYDSCANCGKEFEAKAEFLVKKAEDTQWKKQEF